MELTAAPILPQHALLGEGPIWDPAKKLLYWVDILASTVYAYDPATNTNTGINVTEHVGTVVVREKGGLMVALREGFASVDLTTGLVKYECKVAVDGVRFNEGKCDPAGRFWAGTMAYNFAKGAGKLYRLNHDLTYDVMVEGVTCSNGIVWSADATVMYYIDTPTKAVDRFDYDNATGDIKNRRSVIQVDSKLGSPDGMAIDAEGMLWVAMWGGAKVVRYDPRTGQPIGIIHVPGARNSTALAFAGPDLRDIFITSAGQNTNPAEQPNAGALFYCRSPIPGAVSFTFKG